MLKYRARNFEDNGKVVPNYRCRHHIKNRKDGGKNTPDNLLKIWRSRERLFHELFGDMTLHEAGDFLHRVARAKKAQRYPRQ